MSRYILTVLLWVYSGQKYWSKIRKMMANSILKIVFKEINATFWLWCGLRSLHFPSTTFYYHLCSLMGKNRRSHRYKHDILLNIGRIQAVIKLTEVYTVWHIYIYIHIRCVWSRSTLWNIAMNTQSGNNVHLPHRLNLSERGTRVLPSGCSAVRGNE